MFSAWRDASKRRPTTCQNVGSTLKYKLAHTESMWVGIRGRLYVRLQTF